MLCVQIPKACLVGASDVIGVWSGVRELSHAANGTHIPGRQISRLGQPLVNEVVIGLRDKGKFNRGEPKNDPDFLDYVTNPTFPALVNLLFRDAGTNCIKPLANDSHMH